jgi:hypothetical protein
MAEPDLLPFAPAGAPVRGVLHIFVAFDWGDEINLELARRLVPASFQVLPRRRRTPPSFSYRPAPLHVALGAVPVELDGLGVIPAPAGVTIFDFGAVSLAFRIPFDAPRDVLVRLAGSLAESTPHVQRARDALRPLFDQLVPAIEDPLWSEALSEEYFVFQLAPAYLPDVQDAAWLAGLVHLEAGPLSKEEIAEATRLRLSYSPDDLFVPDWAAAVLVDVDCDETLQAVEFANLQLLEFRHIDDRLDKSLTGASRMIRPLTRQALPVWRMFDRPLRVVGELKVEANDLFERTGNVLKLVGDPYLARVYRLVAARFHLETWEQSIKRKLEITESVYRVVADQARDFRMEFLEVVVVLLIFVEIILAFTH